VLAGQIRDVRVTRRHGPRLEAVLDDGSGRILLCWVGRDAIPGIEPGASIVVEGTVGSDRGRLRLLNPLYELTA